MDGSPRLANRLASGVAGARHLFTRFRFELAFKISLTLIQSMAKQATRRHLQHEYACVHIFEEVDTGLFKRESREQPLLDGQLGKRHPGTE
ncbi:hypothetical protein CEXT_451811 [Caerostris extrusa]|uniref:Uncharacterized protein n=1 Tax=Caerostris extrusa TaxID=172846 RepID=A0AAV4PB20_CAEEX|nr:hypothetical protein CEXT_451811 [Caerostris extrusa]